MSAACEATHAAIRQRSYTLLDEARSARKKYNSSATCHTISEECRKRTGLMPYPEQLDLAECMLLSLDATSIAGTGWGKTLPFVLPLFAPQSKNKIVVIILPLNVLEVDQVSIKLIFLSRKWAYKSCNRPNGSASGKCQQWLLMDRRTVPSYRRYVRTEIP